MARELQKELQKWYTPIDWWYMIPPGRPGRNHLDLVQEFSKEAESALILGSTPEFRDLCSENSIEDVHVIDCSPRFHEHVSKQCIYPHPNETVIFESWQRAIPALSRKFDLVLGDLISGNVPYDERCEMYCSINNLLTPDGVFIERILTNRDGYRPLAELDQLYQQEPANLATVNKFANDYFFTSELTSKAGTVDASMLRTRLQSRFVGNPRLEWLLDRSTLVVPPHGFWYYGKPWNELAPMHAENFGKTEIHRDHRASPEFESRVEAFICTKKPTI
jgi:hypothetical protein